jgi:DNA-3-methyladenine glycosylase I
LKRVLTDERIIRNRLKVYATRKNAQVFIEIQKECGSFDRYLWNFVGNKPITHRPKTLKDIPRSIPASVALSKDLKKRGMSFVGGGIIYAYMQAVGLVNDHMRSCYCAKQKGNRRSLRGKLT